MAQAKTSPATPQAPPIPPLPGQATPGATQAPTGTKVSIPEQIREQVQREIDQAVQRQGGTPITVVQPGVPPRNNDIPPEVIPIVGIVFSMVAFMVVGTPIARAIARAIDRRSDRGAVRPGDVAPQLRALQESVDTMAIELERISESQRFTSKLLSERAPALPAGEERGR